MKGWFIYHYFVLSAMFWCGWWAHKRAVRPSNQVAPSSNRTEAS